MAKISTPERIRRRIRRTVLAPLNAKVGGAIRRHRNAGREYRPVFVAGAMGSGTTLLAFSLGQRYDFGCLIEESAHQVKGSSFLHVSGVDGYDTVRSYEEAIRPRDDWQVERGRQDLLDLYRSYAAGDSDLAMDKGPNTNLVRAGFLSRCFPDACFVVVFRDPVATVEGYRRKWPVFAGETLDECIRFHAAIHESFFDQLAEISGEVAFLEYETLVSSYDAVLTTLAKRFGLRPARRTRRLVSRENVEGRGIRNVSTSKIGVVPDANRRAYENLARDEIAKIRDALEPLHARLREAALRPERAGAP